jgi:hypothetical protein
LIRRRKGRLSILFFQFESPVKLSEVCSKYEQLGQLVGVQTQRLVALQESGTNDDFSKQYDVLFTMQEFPSVDALLSWMKKEVPMAEDDEFYVDKDMQLMSGEIRARKSFKFMLYKEAYS